MQGKRVFVSGGAGVIGHTLVEMLHAQGATIWVGDLKPRPSYWPASIRYRQGDLNEATAQELCAFEPDYFFHLAATFERSTETYPFWEETYRHNVQLSHHLVSAFKDLKSLKKIIFASSYLIYDPGLYQFEVPQKKAVSLKETTTILPRNLCGTAKLLHEMELRFIEEFRGAAQGAEGLQTVSARIFRSYGKHSRDVISRWIRDLLLGKTLQVYKKEGLFDYVYAGDVAEGLLRLALSSVTGIVNLGRGQARSIAEVLAILKQHFPNMKITEGDLPIPYEASEADMRHCQEVLGWAPSRSLEDTIPEMIQNETKNPYQELPEQMDLSILITSISKKVPLVQAVRAASKKAGNIGEIVGGDSDESAIARHFVDEFWKMPRLSELKVHALIEFCHSKKIKVILPTRDGELLYFAQHRDELKKSGIHVMVSDQKCVETCLDKLKFYQALQAAALPAIPTSLSTKDLDAAQFVVKERLGAGSKNMGLRLSAVDAQQHAQGLEAPIFQPMIEGNEISADVYVSQSGDLKGVVLRRRDLVVGGESQVTTTLIDQDLESLCAKVVKNLGIRGHAVLQIMIDPQGQPHIIECNSRFGGASTLAIRAGLESFYWYLLEASGDSLRDFTLPVQSRPLRQIRFAEDRVVSL